MADYFNFDGTGKIGTISSAQLPETNGIATQKLYGSVAMESGNYDPYIVMVAGMASPAPSPSIPRSRSISISPSPPIPKTVCPTTSKATSAPTTATSTPNT